MMIERVSYIALSQEVLPFGINVTLIELCGFSTDWPGDSSRHVTPLASYDAIRESRRTRSSTLTAGDQAVSAAAILHVVDAHICHCTCCSAHM